MEKIEKPCKEYTKLANYINKHTSFCGQPKIGQMEFFNVRMGGKRGVLWDEEEDRRYLDYKPVKCKRILEELMKNRSVRNKLTFTRGEETVMDEEERKYSIMHELECDGEKRSYAELKITTPCGKVRYMTKIY